MYFPGERTCLITGANSGIGRAASIELARLGVTMLLVSRNRVRGERLVHDLKQITGNENLKLFIADLSSLQSVKNLADEVREKYSSLDILVNNAGAFFANKHLTEDGIEATFAVNYLSRFLLTNLLADLIKKSSAGRIINVSGENHRKDKIDFNDLPGEKKYNSIAALSQSKLADILFAYRLADLLKDTNVTVNCMHPGVVATNIVNNCPDEIPFTKYLFRLAAPFLRSPEKAAETIRYLAVSPEVSGVTGKYFIDRNIVPSSPATYDKALQETLWQKSIKLTLHYLLTEIQN